MGGVMGCEVMQAICSSLDHLCIPQNACLLSLGGFESCQGLCREGMQSLWSPLATQQK